MSDVFISYARSTEKQAEQVADALRALGYNIWRDDELPAHRAYTEVIEERLKAAKAVVVIWSAEAVKSQWVRAEADIAREAGTLVQLRVDGSTPPLPFNQIQCADMTGWAGDVNAPGWRKVAASVADLIGGSGAVPEPGVTELVADAPLPLPTKPSVAVMPFANLSGDPEQDYFADGMVVEIAEALSRFRSDAEGGDAPSAWVSSSTFAPLNSRWYDASQRSAGRYALRSTSAARSEKQALTKSRHWTFHVSSSRAIANTSITRAAYLIASGRAWTAV